MLGHDDSVASKNILMSKGRDWPEPSPFARATRSILIPIQAVPGRLRSKLLSFRQYVEDQNRNLLQLGHEIQSKSEEDPGVIPDTTGQQNWEDAYRASFETKFGNLDLFQKVMDVIEPTKKWL